MPIQNILLLTNGYGEDSFSAVLLEKLIQLTPVHQFPIHYFVLPLVGKGSIFQNLVSEYPNQISLLTPPYSLPNGGVYLGSRFQKGMRFLDDCIHGNIQNGFYFLRQLRKIKVTIDAVIGVGDFIPPLVNTLFLQKKMYMVACAHTFLLKRKNDPLERLGRLTAHLYRHACFRIYTRDRLTEGWFRQLGLPAFYLGFLGPDMGKVREDRRTIVLLPGSREDWKENLDFCMRAIQETKSEVFKGYRLHIVFSPGRSEEEIQSFLAEHPENESIQFSWSRGDYFHHLFRSVLIVGFAGTALEQAAFLGIPSIEPWRKEALQANQDFIENRQKLLLGEALIPGGNTPSQLSQILENTLIHLSDRQKEASAFSQRVWEGKTNAGLAIAKDILSNLLL